MKHLHTILVLFCDSFTPGGEASPAFVPCGCKMVLRDVM